MSTNGSPTPELRSNKDTMFTVVVVVFGLVLMAVKMLVAKEGPVATDAAPLIYLALWGYITRGTMKSTLSWIIQIVLIIATGVYLYIDPTNVYWSTPLIIAVLAAYLKFG